MQSDQNVTRESGAFKVRVSGTDLAFRTVEVGDPVPTGRQIIEAAGQRPADEFIVLEWRNDGDLKEIDLEDTTDLRTTGAERFIVARSDRSYRFEIDGKRHEWPESTITRRVLLAIAGQDPEKFSVWQEFQKKADAEVLEGNPAHLDEQGVERFYTVMKHTTEGMW